jgi:hypothetical protein
MMVDMKVEMKADHLAVKWADLMDSYWAALKAAHWAEYLVWMWVLGWAVMKELKMADRKAW